MCAEYRGIAVNGPRDGEVLESHDVRSIKMLHGQYRYRKQANGERLFVWQEFI